ncbi:MAG: hypothetical protein JXR05_11050 [Flavobacteriaceae bacterium]
MKKDKSQEPITLPLWGFLDFLKTQGFEISTGEYLNIYKLLGRLNPNTTSFSDFKYILSPLLSKTHEDQEKFHHLFDTYFSQLKEESITRKKASKKIISPETKIGKRKFSLKIRIGLIVILALVISGISIFINYSRQIDTDYQVTEFVNNILQYEGARVTRITHHFENKNLTVFFTGNEIPNSQIAMWMQNLKDNETLKDYTLKINQRNGSISKSEAYTPPQITKIDTSSSSREVQIYLTLLLIIGFIFYEYYKAKNQSFIAELEQGKKPPYVWQFNLTHKPKITWDNEIYQTAHHLRKRVLGDEVDFDIDRTIEETLNHGGLLELTYKPRSKPSEYIVLIDKSSMQSHQASFFSFLANEFSENDIHLEQFFYQGDMLMFWDDSVNKKNYQLTDLIKLYPKHRVLIFGNGHELINSTKCAIKKYGQKMEAWPDIAILTPRPSSDWDYKEKILSDSFVILPANSAGLIELIDTFEKIKSTQLGAWKYEFASAGIEIPIDSELGVKHLSYQLKPEVFKWLCICAVYPQLFWDLTLYLGDCMFDGKSIVTQQNLSDLLRIPWFNKGFIPLEYRQELMSKLDQDTMDTVRRVIVDQMRKNPPKSNTHAYDEYKLNLLVNELLIKDLASNQKKAIKREINAMESHVDLSFYTEIKAVQPNHTSSKLDFILPEEFQNIFKGVGLKQTFARSLLFLFVSTLGVYFLSGPISKVIDSNSLLESVSVIGSTIIYGIAFYLFIRKRSLLNSTEVALYWLMLSIGYFILFLTIKTPLFKLLSLLNIDTPPEIVAVYDFIIIFLVLTISLTRNQVKKGITDIAIAVYWLAFSGVVWVIVLVTLEGFTSRYSSYQELSITSFVIVIASIVFWIYRFRKKKSVNKTEIGIYYSALFIYSQFYIDDIYGAESYVYVTILFILLLVFIARKWNKLEFIRDSSFSIFWIGIFSGLLAVATLSETALLYITVLIINFILFLYNWIKNRILEYETTIYGLTFMASFLAISAEVFLSRDLITPEIQFILFSLLILLFLFINFKNRKLKIHAIELCIYISLIVLLVIMAFEKKYIDIIISVAICVVAILGAIVYKIKANKKLREVYHWDL